MARLTVRFWLVCPTRKWLEVPGGWDLPAEQLLSRLVVADTGRHAHDAAWLSCLADAIGDPWWPTRWRLTRETSRDLVAGLARHPGVTPERLAELLRHAPPHPHSAGEDALREAWFWAAVASNSTAMPTVSPSSVYRRLWVGMEQGLCRTFRAGWALMWLPFTEGASAMHLLDACPLLPPGLIVDAIEPAADRVVILVHAPEAPRPCPACGQSTNRLHSRYERRLLDLPSHGRAVELLLQLRRLRCLAAGCSRQTFAEPLPAEVARRSGRRTARLDGLVGHLGVAPSG